MPAKAYPLAICRRCQKPHEGVDCQTAANLRDQLSTRTARGDDLLETWQWYDAEFAKLGIQTNYAERFPETWRQVTERKPAKDPRELLSKPANQQAKPAESQKPAGKTRGPAPKTREKPAISRENPRDSGKPANETREETSETRAEPAKTREWECKRCGNQWPRRKNAKKPPVECPKCRSRKWKE